MPSSKTKISVLNSDIKRVYKRNTNKPFDQCTQSEVQEGDPVKTNRNEECPGQVTECMLSSSPTESVDHIQNENVPEKGIECMLSPSPTESVDQILNENVPEKEIECMLSPSPTESPSVNIIDNKVSVIRFLHDGIVTDGMYILYINSCTGLSLIFDLMNSSKTTSIAAIE